MAGFKGMKGNGRKTRYFEISVAKICDREMPEILLKSAKAVNEFFDNPDMPLEARAELGARLLMRSMPQRTDSNSHNPQSVINNVLIKLDGIGTDDLRRSLESLRDQTIPTVAA